MMTTRLRLQTISDVAKAIKQAGGLYRIGLMVHEEDGQKLGRFREACNGLDYRAATRIGVFYKFPASGGKAYESTLSTLSR